MVRQSMLFLLGLLLLAAANPTVALDRAALERQFAGWIERTLWPEARKAGVSRATFRRMMAPVTLDWNLPDLAPPGGRRAQRQRQSEFRQPGLYFGEAGLKALAAGGRRQIARWTDTLAGIEKRYGVPKRIIVSIWARESAFGRARIPHDAIRALATEAFMGARRERFLPELVAALKIAGQEGLKPGEMRSSWAGALGQPQFQPSKYLKYAVDFDGDGHRDIWNSVPDSLASIANYLKAHGWQRGRDWGFEVEVPDTLSCTLEGPDRGRPIAEWVRMGVARVAGRRFPGSELRRTGYLLMPAGRHGPAFIVTDNFYVVKAYNESDVYALYVGHLADRFSADRPFVGKWRKLADLSRAAIRRMQERLIARGHDVGGADGLVGFKTRRSIGAWQERRGRRPTCFPDRRLVEEIG